MTENLKRQSVPVSWPELVAERTVTARFELEYVGNLPARLASKPPRAIAITLGSAAESLSLAAIVLGPTECIPLFDLLKDEFMRAVSEFEGGVEKGQSVAASELMNFINAGRCCGAVLPKANLPMENDWLEQISRNARQLSEAESRSLAFAALAVGRVDFVINFIGGKKDLKEFTAGQTFGPNVQGFIRYIAAAIQADADAEAVEPAWREFLDNFPRKLASEMLTWSDLLWTARAMMVQIEHRDAEVAAESLHNLVT